MNQVRFSGIHFIILCLMGMAAGVIITASKWHVRSALFPLVMGASVFLIGLAALLVTLFEKERATQKESVLDFEFSGGVDNKVAIRRTLLSSAWIVGFFIMILLLGFSIAVPLYVFLYLKLYGKEKWGISLIITAATWVFFYGLFVWLLDTHFEPGWILDVMKPMGIG